MIVKGNLLIKMTMGLDGCSREEAIERIFLVEPFCNYVELKDKMREG